LQTGRQKKSGEAFLEISKKIVSRSLRDEIEEWGFTLSIERIIEEGIASAYVDVFNERKQRVLRFRFSGWSGVMHAQRIYETHWSCVQFCSSLDGLDRKIMEIFEEYLEMATV
jgi:hypothetical protein